MHRQHRLDEPELETGEAVPMLDGAIVYTLGSVTGLRSMVRFQFRPEPVSMTVFDALRPRSSRSVATSALAFQVGSHQGTSPGNTPPPHPQEAADTVPTARIPHQNRARRQLPSLDRQRPRMNRQTAFP